MVERVSGISEKVEGEYWQQTREFHLNRQEQNVHIVADIWRIPDDCAFCDRGLQVPATRGYGVCLNRTFLSRYIWRVLWMSAQIGQTKRQSRHLHIWLQWQRYSRSTGNILSEWKYSRKKRQAQVMDGSYRWPITIPKEKSRRKLTVLSLNRSKITL